MMMFNRPAIEAELRKGIPKNERYTPLADDFVRGMANLVLAGQITIKYDGQGRQILRGIRLKPKLHA